MTTAIDFAAIRSGLANLPSDHDAAGEHRPKVSEIFTPEQHANALDPNTPVVVGARGAGKSFWAGVLGQDETRAATAEAYPNLGLDKLIVKPGYSGFSEENAISAKIVDARVPKGEETSQGFTFWQAVIIRAANAALQPREESRTIREVIETYSDPEDAERAIRALDDEFGKKGNVLLVTFDALDTLSRDWFRATRLVDALFEAIWTLRARRSIRAKVFIRPEQLNDESLRFVELPKLRSGRVELEWRQIDLYGLLFWRLANSLEIPNAVDNFRSLVESAGIVIPPDISTRRRNWALLSDSEAQKRVMNLIAGLYMGKTNKKGGTYDWPYKHLADGLGKVTPRSFIKLFVEASKFGQAPPAQVISKESIRHGLREASKVRVDQLGVEYGWVKRALAPLAGVIVPCESQAIFDRWSESNTIKIILDAANDPASGFLPPFPLPAKEGKELELLANAMQRIGLLSIRDDGRVDIPDLFRVAALMLKKGGIPPTQKS
ncbi:MAG TPA: hypothetical protein VG225_13495 [Terracidiphilus sp.]|jgi:hypothetical protein|nr:hypothetical protein [Terracidiphilus sp.]